MKHQPMLRTTWRRARANCHGRRRPESRAVTSALARIVRLVTAPAARSKAGSGWLRLAPAPPAAARIAKLEAMLSPIPMPTLAGATHGGHGGRRGQLASGAPDGGRGAI